MAARKKKPAKRKATKRKIGRPTTYKPQHCKTVVELGKRGKSVTQIAVALGVTRQRLSDWMGANPDFQDAMTHAREASLAWWENAAQAGIVTAGGVSINAALWNKIMACRFPKDYREKQHVEHTGKDGKPITIIADWSPLTGESAEVLEDDDE